MINEKGGESRGKVILKNIEQFLKLNISLPAKKCFRKSKRKGGIVLSIFDYFFFSKK